MAPPKLDIKMPEVPKDDCPSTSGSEADRAALFAQLNQGENITSSKTNISFI